MLSDEEFVTQSMVTTIFYLSNVRDYCLKISFSFLDKECVERANEFTLWCEQLLNKFINESNEIIPKEAIDSHFLVTQYTLDTMDLTDYLLNVNLDTSIVIKIQDLQPGHKEITPELVELMEYVNDETYYLISEFIKFIQNIFEREKNLKMFSYTTPDFIKDLLMAVNLYLFVLERNIKKLKSSPTFISNYEYRVNNLMLNIVAYIATITDPTREDIYIKSISFVAEYLALNQKYIKTDLNPDVQKELTIKSKRLVIRLSRFFKSLVSDVLNARAYFIVAPIILDNFYRSTNYYIYNLNLIEAQNRHKY